MVSNVTVVIRSAGERTVEACKYLVEQQVSKEHIFHLNEKPFSKAIKRNFKIGIEQWKRWTLAVDSDILIKRNAITELISNVEKLDNKILDKLYVYQGNVLCKVFGKPRQAGFHLYQTKFLEKALEFIPKDKFAIRPESSTYRAMNKLGYVHYIDDKVYALHDYEQYYRDMFRNGFFQTRKHFYRTQHLMEFWKEGVKEDMDYKALLYGWVHGLINNAKVQVDVDFFDKIVGEEFPKLGIEEKPEITIGQMEKLSEFIEQEIKRVSYQSLQTQIYPTPAPSLGRKARTVLGNKIIYLGKILKRY